MPIIKTISGRIILRSDTPTVFIARSSSLSPMLPKLMSDASKMASGIACGMSDKAMYQKNLANTSMVNPLPISSSMYRQVNCIINTNRHTKNAPAKSVRKFLVMNMSSFFIGVIITGCADILPLNRQIYEE